MTRLLNIRLIQIRRELNDAGPGVFLILGIVCVLIYGSYTLYQKTPDAYYLTTSLFLICLSVHTKRPDKLFVYTHVNNPRKEMYLEYLALTFPFAVSSLATANWFCFPLLIVLLFVIPFFKYTLKQRTYFKNISSVIPSSDFEWISGFRRSFMYMIPLYLLAIGFCWVRIFPLALLWLITIIIASFYNECEPLQMLKAGSLFSEKLIRKKLFRHSRSMVLLYAPVLIINTVFNVEYWQVNLLFIPAQVALLCFAICLKYSNYRPHQKNIANNVMLSLMALAAAIPWFLPVTLLMTHEYYTKAKTNLDNYLND